MHIETFAWPFLQILMEANSLEGICKFVLQNNTTTKNFDNMPRNKQRPYFGLG